MTDDVVARAFVDRLVDAFFCLLVAVAYWIAIIPMAISPLYWTRVFLDPSLPSSGIEAHPTLLERLRCAAVLLPAGLGFAGLAALYLWSSSPALEIYAAQLRLRTWAFGRCYLLLSRSAVDTEL